MNTSFIFTLIASFAILYIGIITVYHDRKSVSNRFFEYISISTVLWSFANYFSLNPFFVSQIYWARLVLFFAVPHIVFFYFFVKNFPSQNLVISRKVFLSVSILAIFIMGLTLTPYVFSSIKSDGSIPVPGKLIPVFAIFILGLLSLSIFEIIRKYRNAASLEKRSWKVMLIGFVTSYVFLIGTNFVLINLNNNSSFILYGPAFMIPTVIGIAYSIMRYRLLNVKAIATEIVAFILLSATLVQVFLSQTATQFIFNIILFITFLILSIILVRSVLREVEQKERLEILRLKLEDANIQLENANDKLKDLDKLKTEFLSLASHQLRSPLTAIKGYTSMILEGDFGEINPQAKDATERVFQSTMNLTKIVEDLLNVSKIEQGGMKYEMAPFSVVEIAGDMAKDLSITAEKKGLTLSFESDDASVCTVNGDKEKIRQVVLNFIDNSIKYTKEGSILVSVRRIKDVVVFAVKDTGMGMTPEIKAKLFQKFSRGDGARMNTGGSGLGLYLAKEIIEAHKGTVDVTSEGMGKGSTFSFTLSAVV